MFSQLQQPMDCFAVALGNINFSVFAVSNITSALSFVTAAGFANAIDCCSALCLNDVVGVAIFRMVAFYSYLTNFAADAVLRLLLISV